MTTTSKQTHTPGPWAVFGSIIVGQDSDGNSSTIATISHFWRNREIDNANASLIAAAPELLEVAKAAYVWIEGNQGLSNALKAVIAQAEGGQP